MTSAAAGHPGLFFISLGLASAAFWGASDFLGGLAARRIHVALVVAVAHSLSLVLLLAIAIAMHAPMPEHRFLLLGLCAGAFGGLALILFYHALSLAEMGLTTAVTGLLTALIPVGYACATQGWPTSSQIAGFAVAAVAIGLIAYTPSGRAHPVALVLATLAGICFGVFLIVLQVGRTPGMVWELIFSRIASATLAIALALVVWTRSKRNTIAGQADRDKWVWFAAGSAGILEAVGTLLYMGATRAGRLDIAAVLASLYPAVTILLAAWILREKTKLSQALGMGLALFAVVLISL